MKKYVSPELKALLYTVEEGITSDVESPNNHNDFGGENNPLFPL